MCIECSLLACDIWKVCQRKDCPYLAFISINNNSSIDDATTIPVVTKIKEGKDDSNVTYEHIAIVQFIEEIEERIETGVAFFDKSIDDEDPIYRFMIDLEDCQETEQEDFRTAIWDELDSIVEHKPDIKPIDTSTVEQDLRRIQSIMLTGI